MEAVPPSRSGDTEAVTDPSVEYHEGTGALKVDVETSYNQAAYEAMAEDTNFILLQRDRGAVHSCHAVDEAALEAFQRDGVIQVKASVGPETIEIIHDAIALRRTAAVLGRVVSAKKKSLGLMDQNQNTDTHFNLMGKNGGWMDRNMFQDDPRFLDLAKGDAATSRDHRAVVVFVLRR